MPKDTTIDDAIATAQDKIEGKAKEEEVKIEGVDENTEEAPVVVEEPENQEAAEEGDPGDEQEQVSDEQANAETTEAETGQTEQATQVEAIGAPAFLSAETKALWSKIPADAQKALSQDALRTQQQLSRSANESQRSKAWEERVNSDFTSKEELDAHRARLKLNGQNDEVDELHNYRNWNRVFKNDPVTGVKSLLAEHEITLEQLSGETLSEEQEQYVNDPRVDDLIEQFQKEREQKEADKKAATARDMQQKVDSWKSGKDKFGQPRSKFVGLYAPQIDNEWQSVLNEAAQNGIQLSLDDSLTEALNRVQDRVYKAHGINPVAPKPLTPEQKKAHVSKVQAAVTKATGAPRSETVTKRPRKEHRNDKEWADDLVNRAEQKLS